MITLFVVTIVGGAVAYGLYAYATVDHLGILDSPIVADRAHSACDQLSRDVHVVADDLLAGRHPTLVIPTVDDIPITHRMTDVSSCTVVDDLAKIT